jgi:cell division protein ZapA
MEEKNVVRVEIFGTGYTIRGEEDQEYIREVAAYVDEKMREINDRLPIASLGKVAVLASLTIADELFKERQEQEKLADRFHERADSLAQELEACLEEA